MSSYFHKGLNVRKKTVTYLLVYVYVNNQRDDAQAKIAHDAEQKNQDPSNACEHANILVTAVMTFG